VPVGLPAPPRRIDVATFDFFGQRGQLTSSWYEDCLPSRDFSMLVDLHLQGRFDLDRFVSETIFLGDAEEAIHRIERGERCVRSL
jgi:S-(hydroxymethyl)mycothiol dehydrogenase